MFSFIICKHLRVELLCNSRGICLTFVFKNPSNDSNDQPDLGPPAVGKGPPGALFRVCFLVQVSFFHEGSIFHSPALSCLPISYHRREFPAKDLRESLGLCHPCSSRKQWGWKGSRGGCQPGRPCRNLATACLA